MRNNLLPRVLNQGTINIIQRIFLQSSIFHLPAENGIPSMAPDIRKLSATAYYVRFSKTICFNSYNFIIFII